ncbi:hypothetical protein CBS101457_004765 [Exobasidium rhododendri]|nr:hypothetical protein CBS101457_004765 [Exobasidium rhododendri]
MSDSNANTASNASSNSSTKQRKTPLSPLSRLPEPALSRGAEVTPPVLTKLAGPMERSASFRSQSSHRSYSSTSSSPPFPANQAKGNRHLSQGGQTRPTPQPTSTQKDLFEMAVASSSLSSSSEGLQALLRDHPELVSTTLSAAAGPGWNEVSESTRGSRHGSQPGTPGEDSDSESHVLTEAPSVGEGGPSLAHLAGPRPNLGSTGAKPDRSEQKIVVAMVGLPARGKSYLSNKLMRYLRWLEYDVKVFNVGQLRRALAKAKLQESGKKEDHTANFFDPQNPAAFKLRTQMAEECLEQLIGWLKKGGNVGIHDATNSSKFRREAIAARIAKEPDLKLIFLESLCTDPEVIAANIAVKVSSGDPDYAGMSPDSAREDFLSRIKHYEDTYETVDGDGTEAELSYCKITDVGRSVTVNQIHGYLESRIAFYLMNLHLTPRNIFFSRHGESQFNVEGKIGGDADLSERGWAYAKALPQLIKDAVGDAPLTVWHSTLKRTAQTASYLPYPKLAWKSLDELDAGVCDAMTYEEVEKYYPEDYASRDEDKFNYRYRGGESYFDVVTRLEPVIMELERQDNILIIGHQAILRALYAYFHALSQDDLPYIKIPLHTLVELTPAAFGTRERRFKAPIEAVDTHRDKPAPRESVLASNPPSPKAEDAMMLAATSAPPSQVDPSRRQK